MMVLKKKDGDGDDDDCKEKVMMMIARRRRCPRSQLETCSGHSLSRETSGPRPPEPFATFERGEQFGRRSTVKDLCKSCKCHAHGGPLKIY